jgi:hypothetical protein
LSTFPDGFDNHLRKQDAFAGLQPAWLSEPHPIPRLKLRLSISSRYEIADAAFGVAKLFKNHRKNIEPGSPHF